VGSKKPNDLGLFDMHGNVWTWCQEKFQNYQQGQGEKTSEDKEDILSVTEQDYRVWRGAAFISPPEFVRSACRYATVPSGNTIYLGFRPARTFAP
jgi:formylglycine-generating enzyme required for sulfatase activity